jgi:hypothetical protein
MGSIRNLGHMEGFLGTCLCVCLRPTIVFKNIEVWISTLSSHKMDQQYTGILYRRCGIPTIDHLRLMHHFLRQIGGVFPKIIYDTCFR